MEVTVAVAERREVVRRGLEAMLSLLPAVTWRSYGSLDEALDPGAAAPAQVIVVDVDVLRAAGPDQRQALGPTRVLATVARTDAAALSAAVQVPVDGYVLLPELSTAALGEALTEVAAGRRHLPDRLSTFLLSWARAGTPDIADRAQLLSAREREVLDLLVAGLSNKEIGRELGISLHGAKRHVSSILSKLNSPSRSHVVSSVLRAEAWDRVAAPTS